jgi:hypothetical protein
MQWLGESRCACRLLAPLLFGAALSAANAVAQDNLVARSAAPDAGPAIELRIWKSITLGINKGVDAYREALAVEGVRIGDSADEILGRPAFPYAGTKTQVQLVILSVAELGPEANAVSHAEVYRRAKQMGLELCPAEVGPQLRLEYRNQPLGEALDIAMEPVSTYAGEPTILALVNFGTGLALIGADGRFESMVPRARRFVFALPARERLEARPSMLGIVPN